MKRSPLDHHPCSIARTLDVVGEWWTLLILRDVAYGVRRFGEIQEDLGVSANVLADRLEVLVGEGLLETRAYQERPPRHDYHLTEKGSELVPALLALMQWGDRWKWPQARGPVRVVHAECAGEVHVAPYCPQCQRELAAAELRAKPRGGVVAVPAEHAPGHITGERLRAARHDGLSLEG